MRFFSKSRILIILIFLTITFQAFSLSFDQDFRSSAMGGISVSGTGNEITFFSNPASIYFYNQKQEFVFQASVYDNHDDGTEYVLEKPELCFKGLFIGKAVSLGFGGDLYVSDMNIKDNQLRYYTGLRRFDIELSAAYGYKNFAFGGSVYSGSYLHNPNVEVNKDKAFADLVSDALFAEHTRLSNSEFVNICFGVIYNFSRLSFSAKSDRILSYEGTQKELSFDEAMESVCLGLYYNRDRYGKRGRLNNWVFSAGVEGCNVFDSDNATLNAGAEIGFQLSRDYNINLRLGYESLIDDFDEGWKSIGVGARLEKINLGFVYKKPLKNIEKDKYRIGFDLAFLI